MIECNIRIHTLTHLMHDDWWYKDIEHTANPFDSETSGKSHGEFFIYFFSCLCLSFFFSLEFSCHFDVDKTLEYFWPRLSYTTVVLFNSYREREILIIKINDTHYFCTLWKIVKFIWIIPRSVRNILYGFNRLMVFIFVWQFG